MLGRPSAHGQRSAGAQAALRLGYDRLAQGRQECGREVVRSGGRCACGARVARVSSRRGACMAVASRQQARMQRAQAHRMVGIINGRLTRLWGPFRVRLNFWR